MRRDEKVYRIGWKDSVIYILTLPQGLGIEWRQGGLKVPKQGIIGGMYEAHQEAFCSDDIHLEYG